MALKCMQHFAGKYLGYSLEIHFCNRFLDYKSKKIPPNPSPAVKSASLPFFRSTRLEQGGATSAVKKESKECAQKT